jgi:3'-5' exoribonuclease
LHDIGKIRELNYKIKIDYSDQGRLLSHIVIGVLMLREKIESLKDFPGQAALLLEHMIVSHHGSKEFGSPEPPKTVEAVMLNYIDEIDAKVNGIREFIESEDTQENWTSYHRLLERHFYKKNHMEG